MAKIKKIKMPNNLVVDLEDAGVVRYDEATSLTDNQKAQAQLNFAITKTTMDSVAVAGTQYYLGVQTEVSVVLPATAILGQCIKVCFYSGSTPTALSITGDTIGNIVTPVSNQRIEINMIWDGRYWAITSDVMKVMIWDPYLTFWSPNSFIVGCYEFDSPIKGWDGTMEYSTDLVNWTIWDGSEPISSANTGTNYHLYLRGTNNTYVTAQSEFGVAWVLYKSDYTGNVSDVYCEGNIEAILDYQTVLNGNHPTMAIGAFCNMFSGSGLVSAPALPATTVEDYCYKGMFSDCSSLTTAPELPATILAESCYDSMFDGCTSLTTAPELPATTLANYCYTNMFDGCTSLTTAPELPATTLANYCYYEMFRGWTYLTTAPELPATALATGCYSYMFSGCTSLTTAPELPATALAIVCYTSMFSGCISLTTAPELPATTLEDNCYQAMFSHCTSLTTAPALPATTLASYCYTNMFDGCTSLTTAPALPATTLTRRCYDEMFENCTSLTALPALPATTLADYCYRRMFYGCSRIKISITKTGEYVNKYRIPTTGTGTDATDELYNMFYNTGGTFKGTPEINTTYYTSNTIV